MAIPLVKLEARRKAVCQATLPRLKSSLGPGPHARGTVVAKTAKNIPKVTRSLIMKTQNPKTDVSASRWSSPWSSPVPRITKGNHQFLPVQNADQNCQQDEKEGEAENERTDRETLSHDRQQADAFGEWFRGWFGVCRILFPGFFHDAEKPQRELRREVFLKWGICPPSGSATAAVA